MSSSFSPPSLMSHHSLGQENRCDRCRLPERCRRCPSVRDHCLHELSSLSVAAGNYVHKFYLLSWQLFLIKLTISFLVTDNKRSHEQEKWRRTSPGCRSRPLLPAVCASLTLIFVVETPSSSFLCSLFPRIALIRSGLVRKKRGGKGCSS